MSEYQTLRIDRPRQGVLVASLHRPDRLNALTNEMFCELVTLQQEVEQNDAIRVLVLTGSGRAFCAGLDLDLVAMLPSIPAADMLRQQEAWARSVSGFTRLPIPVIAAVNGAAAGAGMSLTLAADIRVAASDTRFNAAFIRIGLSGGDVGTSYALPRLVGLGRAGEILLPGRFVGAEEAHRIGLVTEIVAPDQLLARALEIAATICGNSPTGVRLTKQALLTNVDAPSLDAALAIENRNQVLAMQTLDMPEALSAFRQKRAPTFAGH